MFCFNLDTRWYFLIRYPLSAQAEIRRKWSLILGLPTIVVRDEIVSLGKLFASCRPFTHTMTLADPLSGGGFVLVMLISRPFWRCAKTRSLRFLPLACPPHPSRMSLIQGKFFIIDWIEKLKLLKDVGFVRNWLVLNKVGNLGAALDNLDPKGLSRVTNSPTPRGRQGSGGGG